MGDNLKNASRLGCGGFLLSCRFFPSDGGFLSHLSFPSSGGILFERRCRGIGNIWCQLVGCSGGIVVGTAESPLPVLQCRWRSGFLFWLFLLAFGLGTVTLAGMKPTFLNSFGAVLSAVKASWILKLAVVFAVGVPVSFAQESSRETIDPTPFPYRLVSDGYVSSASYRLGYHSDTNIAAPNKYKRNWRWQWTVPWFGWELGRDVSPDGLDWYELTIEYWRDSADSDPGGYKERELSYNDRADDGKFYDNVEPVMMQCPRRVITSSNYPNAQWDLRSDVEFAVDVETLEYSSSYPNSDVVRRLYGYNLHYYVHASIEYLNFYDSAGDGEYDYQFSGDPFIFNFPRVDPVRYFPGYTLGVESEFIDIRELYGLSWQDGDGVDWHKKFGRVFFYPPNFTQDMYLRNPSLRFSKFPGSPPAAEGTINLLFP